MPQQQNHKSAAGASQDQKHPQSSLSADAQGQLQQRLEMMGQGVLLGTAVSGFPVFYDFDALQTRIPVLCGQVQVVRHFADLFPEQSQNSCSEQ